MIYSSKILKLIGMAKVQMPKLSTATFYNTLSVTLPKPYVVLVELNRPDQLNSINKKMWLEIRQCFENLSSDPECRVIILSGGGSKVFSAGIDFNDMMSLGAELNELEDIARKSNFLLRVIKSYQSSLTSIEKCNKPVIGVVHGPCVGGGVDLICCTDIRYCTSDAWFQIKEVDIGMAADVGTLQRMPKIIGSASLVNELALTCRKFHADEAQQSGFVSKIFNSKENMINNAVEIAVEIASKSPVAVQGTKQSLIYSRDHSVEEGLNNIALYNMTMLQSEDFVKAVAAQINKEKNIAFSKL